MFLFKYRSSITLNAREVSLILIFSVTIKLQKNKAFRKFSFQYLNHVYCHMNTRILVLCTIIQKILNNFVQSIFENISLKVKIDFEQDGPSLESSSYLNVTLRYLDPFDPETMGPWDAWTF